MLKRYIVEFGTGADLHGGNVTKASQKAIKDAISHGCLCGLSEILGFADPNAMHIEAKIACPFPEMVDQEQVLEAIPFGSVNMEIVQGGLSVRGLGLPVLGEGDSIMIAVAALTVYIEV